MDTGGDSRADFNDTPSSSFPEPSPFMEPVRQQKHRLSSLGSSVSPGREGLIVRPEEPGLRGSEGPPRRTSPPRF